MDVAQFGIVVQSELATLGDITYPVVLSLKPNKRNATSERFQCPGVDAVPLSGDYALLVPVQRSGGTAFVGAIDVENEPVAEAGEYRTYARDEAGVIVSEIWQHNDGQIEVKNDKASATIDADGTITVNNENATVTIAADGSVTMDAKSVTVNSEGELNVTASAVNVNVNQAAFSGEVTAVDFITESGISLKDHKHGGVQTGGGQTGAPV